MDDLYEEEEDAYFKDEPMEFDILCFGFDSLLMDRYSNNCNDMILENHRDDRVFLN